ncbi:hypothetical protein Lal_00034887 [Lupinus albus]|nr:hypothetical protein Lal_00034887 [Lupinus albus]
MTIYCAIIRWSQHLITTNILGHAVNIIREMFDRMRVDQKLTLHWFMVKNYFIPIISEEKKKEENPRSVEFQVVNFTNKIRRLTSHLELHRKDYLSQRGLRKILGKRQRLLSYLSKKNGIRYKKLIKQ